MNIKKYELSFKTINTINSIQGPNISYENMSFFKENDKNKTLLIYDGGGFGDKIMFSRFIPKLCNSFKDNKIIFFVSDKLVWFFNKVFKNIHNLRLVHESTPIFIGKYDYHCSLLSLLKHFNITYDKLYTVNIQ